MWKYPQTFDCLLQNRKGEYKIRITEICDVLRQELYQNEYQYGFYYDGRKYTPVFLIDIFLSAVYNLISKRRR